jgi:hypothetical protein
LRATVLALRIGVGARGFLAGLLSKRSQRDGADLESAVVSGFKGTQRRQRGRPMQ